MPLKNVKPTTQRARKSPAAGKPRDWTPEQKQQIAERAYQYFLSRNEGDGDRLEDWLRAEQEFAASLDSPRTTRRKRAEVLPISA